MKQKSEIQVRNTYMCDVCILSYLIVLYLQCRTKKIDHLVFRDFLFPINDWNEKDPIFWILVKNCIRKVVFFMGCQVKIEIVKNKAKEI